MKRNYTLRIAYAALFAALIFVGTQFLQIPLPFGYFNLGDCFILMSAVIVGGPYAVVAAAVGATLADVLSGYVVYAPATMVIKALMAVVMILMGRIYRKKQGVRKVVWWVIGAVLAELTMMGGYFAYDAILYGPAGALASLPGNALQGLVAVVSGVLIMTVLDQTHLMRHISWDK